MLQQVRIVGFRGFSDITLDLAQTTVLLGKNSCGKTSVLQAIRLACTALSWVLQEGADRLHPKLISEGDQLWLWLHARGTVRDDEDFLLAHNWAELFSPERMTQGLEITLTFGEEDFVRGLWVKLARGRAEALRLSVAVQGPGVLRAAGHGRIEAGPPGDEEEPEEPPRARGAVISRTRFIKPIQDALRGKTPLPVFIPSFYGTTRQEEYHVDAMIDHLLANGEQARIVRNLVVRLDKLTALNQDLRRSVNAELTARPSGRDQLEAARHLAVAFRDTNGALELASAGTGLVSLVALLAAVAWHQERRAAGQPMLILLDEPEAHLHPQLQGDTALRLKELADGNHAQLILATHSVEIVNRLGPPFGDAALLAIDRSSARATLLTSESAVLDELRRWCDLSPFASLNLLRSRRVLFHEGPTDAALLDACASLYFAQTPDRQAQYKQWTKIALHGVDNAQAKDLLERALEPLFAQNPGEPVRVVRVLDRDHHRVPQMGPMAPRRGLQSFEVVWSRHSIESLFLDMPILAEWLWYALTTPSQREGTPDLVTLQGWIQEALAAADGDPELRDRAADQLALRRLRSVPDNDDQQRLHTIQEARAQVQREPAVYQQGHARSEFVLAHIRARLVPALQNRIRRDITSLVRSSRVQGVFAISAAIPAEIRQLLEHLVS